MLNHSICESTVPRVWKLANVPPLPKAPSIEDFNKDLRPISLTSTLSKVAEGFVIDREVKSLIPECMDPNQFGFIPYSYTTFALMSMMRHWLEATDGNGAYVRAALLDCKKAFYLEDHDLLIANLYSLGVKSTVLCGAVPSVSSLALIVSRTLHQSPLEFHRVPASALGSFLSWLMTSLPRATPFLVYENLPTTPRSRKLFPSPVQQRAKTQWIMSFSDQTTTNSS